MLQHCKNAAEHAFYVVVACAFPPYITAVPVPGTTEENKHTSPTTTTTSRQ
jgi:beta-lactamase regulating signal transducer with metallopeptidase domain